MRHRIFLLLMVLWLCRVAGAQEAPPADDPKARATALAREGAELARNGQYAEAISKFQESLGVFVLVDVYYNLAYSYEQIGDWEGCVTQYGKYVDAYKADHSGAEPPEIISVRRSIEKCREIAQPPITITSEPAGAQVALGSKDKVIGATPLTQKLEPGTYPLFVWKDEYTPVETTIVVQPKQPGKFHFDLRKLVNTGKVRINVNVKDATIYIDGKNYGISPYLETPELDVGRHQVVVKREKYGSVNTTFDVLKDQTTTLDYTLYLVDPPPSWRSYIGWTGVSVGVVLIAGGIVAWKFAEQEFNDTDKFKELELLQNVGYGTGGALLGVGTVMLIWEAFTDAVDSDDLIDVTDLPVQLGVLPMKDGAYLHGTLRF